MGLDIQYILIHYRHIRSIQNMRRSSLQGVARDKVEGWVYVVKALEPKINVGQVYLI